MDIKNTPARPPVPREERALMPYAGWLRDGLVRCGVWAGEHSDTVFVLLLLVYAFTIVSYSRVVPLWHDELFTFQIAQAPTLHDLLYEIRTLDLNPPLSYLLTRLSFHLFGVGTLSCRLPEMLGFALAMTALFLAVRRRAGGVWGLLAAALLLGSNADKLSLQARPYGLVLGFIALALLCWQTSIDREGQGRSGLWASAGLALSLLALLLTHVFGLLAWAALLGGELLHIWLQRRVNLPRLLAFAIAASAVLLYGPLLRNHGASAFPPAFQPSLAMLSFYYETEFGLSLLALLCAVGVAALLSRGAWLLQARENVWRLPEAFSLGSLFVIPVLLIVYLRLHHGAWFDRYGTAANLGFAVLMSLAVCWLAGGRPAIAVVAMVAVLLFSGRLLDILRVVRHPHILQSRESLEGLTNLQSLMEPGLPLVDASGLTFVEMNHRMPPALLNRVYYLTDPAAAMEYAHATIFEGMAREAQEFGFRGHVEPYAEFMATHPRFYVFGTLDYPEDWLLRKLQAEGDTIRLLPPVISNLKDHELYEITRPGH